ncbi:MAG: superoxide dismutase family protein [Rhodospirillales bacterium]|nr:MAG: superoxide dismutase family protein [Rhodospirillales bacterium]
MPAAGAGRPGRTWTGNGSMHMRTVNLSAAAAVLIAGGLIGVAAADTVDITKTAEAQMIDRDGNSVGTVTLRQTHHGTLLHARLHGLAPGVRGFHIHETGVCEPPDFTSADGHYNPTGDKHGFLAEEGMHAGDLPNIHIPESGELEIEVLAHMVDLDDNLFDEDGSSIVIHEDPDDYETDPAGDAGPRIACGVIER